MSKELTIADIVERVRYVMRMLGITDHLPTYDEIVHLGGIHQGSLKKCGNIKGLSMLMGLPKAPRNEMRKKSGDVYSMEDVKPSQAFKKQRESGKLWADTQKAETLQRFGGIDLSRYEGLQTYAERTKHGKERKS